MHLKKGVFMSYKKATPFLKWAGGKTQLLNDIEKEFPYNKNDVFSYVEPFVGGGAVLFWVLNNFPNLKSIVINDINEDLINIYKTIKSNVIDLIFILRKYEIEYHSLSNNLEYKKEFYYEKRELFNSKKSDQITQSALFIFLNKTCFNGLYRVNKDNKFNVPIGSYKKPMICDEENLIAVSNALKKVKILSGDFEQTLDFASKYSLFYLDPPYKPLSETSSFTAYSKNEFNDDEQKRLKLFCDKLDSLGCKWILSNSDVKGMNPNDNFFDNLYSNYKINRVMAKRSINVKSNKRGKLTELLITNQGICYEI